MKTIHFTIFLLFILTSCYRTEPVEPEQPFHINPPGVFVVNEGNFTFGNSSLTYFNTDNYSVIPDMFYFVNKAPLGDVANYMMIKNKNGYIVVNNSGVVYIIDVKTGLFKGKLSGLLSPREIAFANNKMVITDLAEPYLTVVDFNGQEKYSKVNLDGYTSESIVTVGDKIYVSNWSAMYQEKKNNQVLVIDANQMKLIDSIRVTQEPNSMVVDKNMNIWVLCSGGYMHQETPALIKISSVSDSVTKVLLFDDNEHYPTELHINKTGDRLYYIDKDVFTLQIDDDSLPSEPLINSVDKTFYALGIDPVNEKIFVSDALNYIKRGKVYIYTKNGEFVKVFGAGIVPGYFAFYN